MSAGCSTWQDFLWRSRFHHLQCYAPQNGIATPLQHHRTTPCPSPCRTDPPPPAAAPLPTVAQPQGAPPPSRKTAMAPRWWEDTRPKLPRRSVEAGWEGKTCRKYRDEGGDLNQTDWLPGPIYQTPLTLGPVSRKLCGKYWNKRLDDMDRIRQTNQLTSSAVAVAKLNPKKLGWKAETWSAEGTERERKKEEKETAGHRQLAKKREQSPATNATFLQVRQSDASGNSSFLPGLEEALLPHSLSPVSVTALTTSPAEPRN